MLDVTQMSGMIIVWCVCVSYSVVSDSLRPYGLFHSFLLLSRLFHSWDLPSPGDLPNPGIEPGSPTLQADSLPLSHQGSSIVC